MKTKLILLILGIILCGHLRSQESNSSIKFTIGESSKLISLIDIKIDATKTDLTVFFSRDIIIFKPKTEYAFFIQDVLSGNKFNLIGSSINLDSIIQAKKEIHLYFDKLPFEASTINLTNKSTFKDFHINNIKLLKEDKINLGNTIANKQLKDKDTVTITESVKEVHLPNINRIDSTLFPCNLIQIDDGYTSTLWLYPESNVTEFYKIKSGLQYFDCRALYELSKLSIEGIWQISPMAFVTSVINNRLYLSENRATKLWFEFIPELNSITDSLRNLNNLVIASKRDYFLSKLIEIRSKYIIANSFYKKTNFDLNGTAYFKMSNYDLNKENLYIHLSLPYYNDKYKIWQGVYIATISVKVPLSEATKLFSIEENFNVPIKFKVMLGDQRRGLGITGGGVSNWEVPDIIILDELQIRIKNKDNFNFNTVGLKNKMWPEGINYSRWDLNIVDRPRSEYTRYILGEFNNVNKTNGIVSENKELHINKQANLNVRLFFKSMNNKVEYEVKDFNSKKEYEFCYDIQEFSKLLIEGNAEHISIVVKSGASGEYIHLKNDDIEIIGKKVYTPKDFDIQEGTIIIKQGNVVIFEAKIKSVGCT